MSLTKIIENNQAMQEYLQNDTTELTNLIVEAAFRLHKKKKQNRVEVITFILKEEKVNYKIVLDRENLLTTLEDNLITLEQYEQYERCAEVFKLINKLKNENNTSNSTGDLESNPSIGS